MFSCNLIQFRLLPVYGSQEMTKEVARQEVILFARLYIQGGYVRRYKSQFSLGVLISLLSRLLVRVCTTSHKVTGTI